MKAKIRIRKLRALAIAGSLSALAAPTVAQARPADVYTPVHPANSVVQSYSLPSGFHTEAQTPSKPQARQPFTPPAQFKPEVQTTASPTSTSPVIREIRTVTNDENRTLAIVLAATALAVALCGSGYAVFSLTRMQRRLPGSSSRALVS